MKTMTTLEEVRETVEEKAANYHDELVPVKDIHFDSMDRMNIGQSETYPLKSTAVNQVSQRFRIPYNYLNRCPPDLQADNLNHWLQKERNEKMFLRFDGEVVRAVFTPKYIPVDHTAVLERLFQNGFKPEDKVQCHLDRIFQPVK